MLWFSEFNDMKLTFLSPDVVATDSPMEVIWSVKDTRDYESADTCWIDVMKLERLV